MKRRIFVGRIVMNVAVHAETREEAEAALAQAHAYFDYDTDVISVRGLQTPEVELTETYSEVEGE